MGNIGSNIPLDGEVTIGGVRISSGDIEDYVRKALSEATTGATDLGPLFLCLTTMLISIMVRLNVFLPQAQQLTSLCCFSSCFFFLY